MREREAGAIDALRAVANAMRKNAARANAATAGRDPRGYGSGALAQSAADADLLEQIANGLSSGKTVDSLRALSDDWIPRGDAIINMQ